jgi:vanillate O-demethylase monooxygenase subunit
MRWTAPSNLLFDLGVSHVGGEPEAGLCTPATHLLTPETAYSTHYFWAQGRNLRRDDRALDQPIIEVNSRLIAAEAGLQSTVASGG